MAESLYERLQRQGNSQQSPASNSSLYERLRASSNAPAPRQPLTVEEILSGGAGQFTEWMAGIGDELGGLGRSYGSFLYDVTHGVTTANGEELDVVDIFNKNFNTDRINMNIDEQRRIQDQFAEEYEAANAALATAGLITGFAIPTGAALKGVRALSGARRYAAMGGIGAAEGATYGYLSGRDEQRYETAAMGALLGGGLGTVIGKLTRSSDEIASMAREDADIMRRVLDGVDGDDGKPITNIGGVEGFVNPQAAQREGGASRHRPDSSARQRKIKTVLSDEEYEKRVAKLKDEGKWKDPKEHDEPEGLLSRGYNYFMNDLGGWLAKNVSKRAAALATRAEWMGRRAETGWFQKIDEDLAGVDEVLNRPENFRALETLFNMGRRNKTSATWDKAYSLADAEGKQAVLRLRNLYSELKKMDFVDPKVPKGIDANNWIKTVFKPNSKSTNDMAPISSYDSLVAGAKEYARELVHADALIRTFNVKPMREVDGVMVGLRMSDGQSRESLIIDRIGQLAQKQSGNKAIGQNLANGLRSQFIASKNGADSVGAILRKWSSIALLGNISNAALNTVEGIAGPLYQNGMKAFVQTLPGAIRSTFRSIPGVNRKSKYWLDLDDLGIKDQWLGEQAAKAGQEVSGDAGRKIEWLNKLYGWQKALAFTDTIGKGFYKATGVSTVNRMGQEMQANSAIKRALNLIRSDNFQEFRRQLGVSGLTDKEVRSTWWAFQRLEREGGDFSKIGADNMDWIGNFAGVSLGHIQPVSAAALPKAFHDNPNGRIAYSMLSYMNRQHNIIRRDIGANIAEMHRRGLNTPEGRAAGKEAVAASMRYMVLYGLLSGVWDRARSSMDPSRNVELDEVMTAEGMTEATMVQLASNLSSGLVNLRAKEFGGQMFNPIPAPIQGTTAVLSGIVEAGVTGDTDPLGRATQTHVPIAANLDRIYRMINGGDRLFVDPKD
jgi:hypothetical protein